MSTYDVIVVGSGIVGATAALAIAKRTSLKVAIFDSQRISPVWQKNSYDHRVSAISLASKKIFQKLNVWEKIQAKRLSAYQNMFVWEERGQAKIAFDCKDVQESALGYIIEDQVMRVSLYETFQEFSNIDFHNPVKLVALHEKSDCIELISDDNHIYKTKLVIAADGAHSWVRDQVGIELKTQDYEHTALVATVKTELPHRATAWQCFLSRGPLAFLPLEDSYYSSIVWSTHPAHATELLAQDETAFCKTLEKAFEYKLGKILHTEQRHAFPLKMRHAKHYVKPRVALVGDAAHTIHPLAGQGVNLGLLDAACLAEVVSTAVERSRDFSSLATLRRYERWRKSDNLTLLTAVDTLKKLFQSESKLTVLLRNFGLNVANQNRFLKNFFVKYALGRRGDLPELD